MPDKALTFVSLRVKRRFDPQALILGGIAALVCYFALVPLIFLIVGSFKTSRIQGVPGLFTFDNYIRAYTNLETLSLLGNTLTFAIATSLVAFGIGTLLAWMNERTNTPFKNLFFGLTLVPLIIPSILFTISWIFLLSPEIGIINTILVKLLGLSKSPFSIYSMGGMVWVDGLHLAPMAFLLMSSAFRAMDPSLEEAAVTSGAGVTQTFFKVTFRLSMPAILSVVLITFVRALEAFEVPALIGLPGGIQVFTSRIYLALHSYPSDIGLAGSLSASLLILTTIGVLIMTKLTRDTQRFSTVTGKGFRPRVMDLGGWKYLTAAIFWLYFTLVILLPLLILLWSSLNPFYAVPSLEGLSKLTIKNYKYVLNYPNAFRALKNSALLALGSATAIMFLTAVVSWIVIRTRLKGRWILDNIAFIPMVFPGIVLGVSIMLVYLNVPIPIYGTIWILLVAYITRFMPYGIRYNSSSMIQIHRELEESAQVNGATWWLTFRRVTLPLLTPGFASGWIYIVIVSIRELSSSILLYSPGSEVISITIWELWENGQAVELSALGVIFIFILFILVTTTNLLSKRFGVRQA